MVGLVIRLARAESFTESGVFEFFTLFLDFTILAMGFVTTFIWFTIRFPTEYPTPLPALQCPTGIWTGAANKKS
jgi:hypothetical protein